MDRQHPTPISKPWPRNPSEKDRVLALENKIDEQQRLIDDLERRLEAQDQQINTLTAPSPASNMNDEVGALRMAIAIMKEDHQETESDISTLKKNRDEMTQQVDKISKGQEQTSSTLTALKLDQEDIQKNNEEIQSWQKQAAKYASEREEKQTGVKDKVFEKINKTRVLAKELQHILKGELQDRTKCYAEFSFTQMVELINQYPYKIEDYYKVRQPCRYFDKTTGVYTVPIRGRYQIYTKISISGNGKINYYLCSSDGTRHEIATVTSDVEGENILTCTYGKGELIWLEATKRSGKATIMDCHFKAELLPDEDEDDNEDDKGNKNAAAADDDDDDNDDDDRDDSGDSDAADILAKLIALSMLAKMQK